MKPDVPAALFELAGQLVRLAEPGVAESDRAPALRMTAGLLAMAAERWDRTADDLVVENRAIAALLGGAAD